MNRVGKIEKFWWRDGRSVIYIGVWFYGIRFGIDDVEEKTATLTSHSCQTESLFFQDMKLDPKNNTRKFLFEFGKFITSNFFLGNVRDGIFRKKMNSVIAAAEYNGNLQNSKINI